jgi:hypothetical protein
MGYTQREQLMFKIVEKKNHLAVHGIFDSLASATRHLTEIIPRLRSQRLLHGQDVDCNQL